MADKTRQKDGQNVLVFDLRSRKKISRASSRSFILICFFVIKLFPDNQLTVDHCNQCSIA